MELYLFLHSNLDHDLERASMSDEPEMVRRLSFGLDKAVMLLESWVLQSSGTMIQSGGTDARFIISAEHLDELLDILRQFQEASEASVSCGVGAEASEAEIALKVARKRGGDPSVVLYTPEIATEAEESEESDSLSFIEDDLEQPMSKGFGEDDLHPTRGEATKITQGDVRPSAAEPSPPSPVSPPSAVSPEDQQNAPQGDQLMQAVGQVLMDVKKQLPTLEKLKQEKPQAYDSILAMVQAVVALAQKLTGGTPQGGMQPVQKSEDDEEFQLGVEKESKEHPSLSLAMVKRLVRDHLKQDSQYYSKESELEKTAPPGFSEETMHELKRKHGVESAFKIAWAAYKKQGNKEELDPKKKPTEGTELNKMKLPEQKPPPAHHHLNLPVGSVKGRSIKVIRPDGTEHWVQVAAGQIMSESGHSISSRNPGGK